MTRSRISFLRQVGVLVGKFVGPNSNGKSGESVNPNLDTVVMTDEGGRTIDCYLEKSMEIDGTAYALLLPVDLPIEIFAWEEDDDGEDSLVDLEDDEVDVVFLTARAVLAEFRQKVAPDDSGAGGVECCSATKQDDKGHK